MRRICLIAISVWLGAMSATAQPKVEHLGPLQGENAGKSGYSYQGMDIFGNYMLSCQNKGVASIYRLSGKKFKLLGQFHLESFHKYNHANVASFGVEKAVSSDPLPVAYVSQCNKHAIDGKKDVLYAERILPDFKSSKLVQTIFYDDVNKDFGYALQWVIDRENNMLYGYGNTVNNTDPANRHRIIKFRLPKLSEGQMVVLKPEDALENYLIEDESPFRLNPIGQGLFIEKGKLYMPTGFGREDAPSILYIWDLNSHTMQGLDLSLVSTGEFEDISRYKKWFYIQGQHGIFRLKAKDAVGQQIEVPICSRQLKRGLWGDDTYSVLSSLIANPDNKGGYAVFDCDNTTVMNDISHSMMVYQIENLRFSLAPEHNFIDGLENVDFVLPSLGITAREMGTVLSSEYATLKKEKNDSLFLDFRARMLAFFDAIGDNYSYGEQCLWEPSLTAGFSKEELLALGRESLDFSLSQGNAWKETWVSPDGRFSGSAPKGLVLTEEIKDLYSCLSASEITPYVCSASVEWLVELLCCNPKYGLGLPADHVFGLRFVENADGSLSYDTSYTQPFQEGKVACINKHIAPNHSDRQPALVAGDSNGDVPMLTSYPDMQVGLLISPGHRGKINELANCHDGRYFVHKATIE